MTMLQESYGVWKGVKKSWGSGGFYHGRSLIWHLSQGQARKDNSNEVLFQIFFFFLVTISLHTHTHTCIQTHILCTFILTHTVCQSLSASLCLCIFQYLIFKLNTHGWHFRTTRTDSAYTDNCRYNFLSHTMAHTQAASVCMCECGRIKGCLFVVPVWCVEWCLLVGSHLWEPGREFARLPTVCESLCWCVHVCSFRAFDWC